MPEFMFKGDGPLARAERDAAAAAAATEDPWRYDPARTAGLKTAYATDIERALESFYEALDQIPARAADAAPDVFLATEWASAVEDTVGDVIYGYVEHMQETWEPVDQV